jgi:hypothetical protein
VLAGRLSVCVSLVTIGLVITAPARAQELIDVAALEAQVEAAAELTELPTEPGWGVQDPLNSLPAVSQDAPEVPPDPAATAQAAPQADQAPRYQVPEPQYHTEYQAPQAHPQAPQADPAPPPAEQAQPAAPPEAPAQAPANPVLEQVSEPSSQAASTPPAQSTPTIWIWVWNWTWIQGSDDRYRNSDTRYQVERLGLDQNASRILEKIGLQTPVQISVQTDGDIADKIGQTISPDSAPIPDVRAAVPMSVVPTAEYRTPPLETKKRKPPARSVERPTGVPLEVATIATRSPAEPQVATSQVATSSQTASAPRETRGSGKPHRARRASPPSSTLPLPGERVGDSGAASGASAAMYAKSFAILITSLLLAAFGRSRRHRLPSLRWRGLLGTRTDPPG